MSIADWIPRGAGPVILKPMSDTSERAGSANRFGSLYAHGFVRVAAAVPRVRVAEPAFNAEQTVALARRASEAHAALVVFPELGLSAYSNEDLFHQAALSDAVTGALGRVVAASADMGPVIVVGAPLAADQRLFNAGIVIHRGAVLGAVPKSYLPNYREYYEKRQFSAARDAISDTVEVLGEEVPFGSELLFECRDLPSFVLGVEVCEDLWAPLPPSTFAGLAGATVLANLSASNITIGKADYRRSLCASQSARMIAAYLYTAADSGESTTDLAWDGQALICENGDLLAESERFAGGDALIIADVDLDRLVADRARTTSFADCAHDYRERLRRMRRIGFELGIPGDVVSLRRDLERFPYVPADPERRDERCEEVYRIQVQGLATRLRARGIERAVIGVSGGLDSTQALIVAVRTMDELGLPRSNVLAYALPGFATSRLTLDNARRLMRALGTTAGEIDIRPSSTQMLRDLGHPAAAGEAVYDTTYENVQAGERTSHLFRLANHNGGLVVGTGDLSELALGWCTYGVGDQMSHYNVNASVPKTLVQFLIHWVADANELGDEASEVLRSVLETAISPELVPSAEGGLEPGQDSESVVGPFELQDFFLYYVLRFGYRPSKVSFLAHSAWHDRNLGRWPDLIPEGHRNEYSLASIKCWLAVFLERFFETSQFKRSALPNAPKVGSGGSLSPRGDWRAPSDASAAVWLEELHRNVPDST
jgi:NAD+ synthase (glutamine-hydrolysing)